jgi:hypothetical protein
MTATKALRKVSWRAIAIRVVKDMWLALAIAVAWTCVRHGVRWTFSWKDVVDTATTFFTAWFFAAGLLSYVLRAKKREEDMAEFRSIDEQVGSVLSKLESAGADLIGYTTGGDSACFLDGPIVGNELHIDGVGHIGKYPVHDIHIRIFDLDRFESMKEKGIEREVAHRESEMFVAIGVALPRHTHPVKPIKIRLDKHGDVRALNAFFTARNGSFVQQMRFAKHPTTGEWMRAILLTWYQPWDESNPLPPITEKVDPEFPRAADGKVSYGHATEITDEELEQMKPGQHRVG